MYAECDAKVVGGGSGHSPKGHLEPLCPIFKLVTGLLHGISINLLLWYRAAFRVKDSST